MKRFAFVLLVGLLAHPCGTQAACTIPYTFSSGTTASAAQINANFAALAGCSSGGGGGGLTSPQGRLTLTTGMPVMNADVTAAATIYYTPYIGNLAPISNGTNFVANAFTQTSVALDTTNVLSGKIYDLFLFLNSSAVQLGYGPAWTSNTARSAAIAQVSGFWVNNASITLRWSSSNTASVAANQALYVGSFYASANGQTVMQFNPAAASGGSAPIMGIYNAYNRVRATCTETDSTTSWTYGTASFRAANNSSSNSIRFIDGLGQSFLSARYVSTLSAGGSATGYISIGYDTSTSTTGRGQSTYYQSNLAQVFSGIGTLETTPNLGLHQIYAIELSSPTTTFYGTGTAMQLQLSLDM